MTKFIFQSAFTICFHPVFVVVIDYDANMVIYTSEQTLYYIIVVAFVEQWALDIVRYHNMNA